MESVQSFQKNVSFECDIHEVANKLNELVNDYERDMFVIDYKVLESAYGVVVIVELDRKYTGLYEEYKKTIEGLEYDETDC